MGNREGWRNSPNNQVPKNNSESIRMVQELVTWPAIDLRDPEQIMQRFQDYCDLCERHHSKLLISGLCMSLSVTRDELVRWSNGKGSRLDRVLTPESSLAFKNLLQTLEVAWESAVQNNGYKNPLTGIFLGKNNFGYADESVNVVKHEDAERGPSKEQLEAKYQAALPTVQPAEVISVETVYELPEKTGEKMKKGRKKAE